MSIASEITRLQNAKASLKTSINAKTDAQHQIGSETLEDYADFVDSIQTGGGSIVNGIIEQYKASTSTIDANTFVEFVNASGGSATSVSTYYQYSKAVLIDTDKVFVAFYDNSNYYAKAVVCTISDFTITVGTITSIYGGSSGYGSYLDVAKLDTNKVFMVFKSASEYLRGVVCDISNTTISKGSVISLVSATAYYYPKIAVLSTTKVLVIHGKSNSTYGVVCNISGTTISTIGTDTVIGSASSGSTYPANSVSSIDTNTAFVTYRRAGSSETSSDNLMGVVCTISGTTTISVGTAKQIANYCGGAGSSSYIYTYYAVKQILIDTNKTLVLHANNKSSHFISGVICSVSGTTISNGSDYVLASSDMGKNYDTSVDGALIGANKIIVVYSTNKLECEISGTTININRNDTYYAGGSYVTLALLDSSRVYLSYYDSSNLKGIVKSLEYVAQESTTKIDGLTKTECTTSTAGDVWVLDV